MFDIQYFGTFKNTVKKHIAFKSKAGISMSSLKHELLTMLNNFKNGTASIDWATMWNDSDLCDLALDGIESFIDNLAIDENVDDVKRVDLVGRLTIARVYLFEAFNKDQGQDFIKAGGYVDQAMREAISPQLLKVVDERFETYEKNEEKISSQQCLSDSELDYYRPVFMAIALMTLLSIDQMSEYED